MNEETITMKQKAEFRASGLLLDLGISIPVRPLRFMTKKKRCGITMRTPALGGLIRISRKYLQLGVSVDEMQNYTFDQNMEFVAGRGKEVSELVACAIVSGYITGRLFNKVVAWWLRWRVHPAYLQEAMLQLFLLLDIKSFSTTIKSAQMMNVMTRRLSHGTTGS